MAPWIRNLVMLCVLSVWAPYVVTSIVRHEQINELIWGVPGGIYMVLNPTLRIRGKPDDREGQKGSEKP